MGHYDEQRYNRLIDDMVDSQIKEEKADRDTKYKKAMNDVASQSHYAYGIEPIDYMKSRFSKEEYGGYLAGNVIKYISRYSKKNGLEDLEKASVYLNWLIEENK